MTQSIAKLTRWSLTVAGTIAFLWLMPCSFLAGNMMARVDLARGHAQTIVSGPLNPWSGCDAAALNQGDISEMQSRILCSISSAEEHFEQGYNAAMHQAMRAHGGHDTHDDSVHRAALDWNRDHPHPRQ